MWYTKHCESWLCDVDLKKKSVDTATIYKPRELPDSGLGLGQGQRTWVSQPARNRLCNKYFKRQIRCVHHPVANVICASQIGIERAIRHRVFVWGRRPDVSSGRFPFHVRYFDFNIWGIFLLFIIIICFHLSTSWVYWLEDNKILQLNSLKLTRYFFSLLIEWNIWLVSRFISKKAGKD